MSDSLEHMRSEAAVGAEHSPVTQRAMSRLTHPVGVIDVRRAEHHYARLTSPPGPRSEFLDHFRGRYGLEDEGAGDGSQMVYARGVQAKPEGIAMDSSQESTPTAPAFATAFVQGESPKPQAQPTAPQGTFRVSRKPASQGQATRQPDAPGHPLKQGPSQATTATRVAGPENRPREEERMRAVRSDATDATVSTGRATDSTLASADAQREPAMSQAEMAHREDVSARAGFTQTVVRATPTSDEQPLFRLSRKKRAGGLAQEFSGAEAHEKQAVTDAPAQAGPQVSSPLMLSPGDATTARTASPATPARTLQRKAEADAAPPARAASDARVPTAPSKDAKETDSPAQTTRWANETFGPAASPGSMLVKRARPVAAQVQRKRVSEETGRMGVEDKSGPTGHVIQTAHGGLTGSAKQTSNVSRARHVELPVHVASAANVGPTSSAEPAAHTSSTFQPQAREQAESPASESSASAGPVSASPASVAAAGLQAGATSAATVPSVRAKPVESAKGGARSETVLASGVIRRKSSGQSVRTYGAGEAAGGPVDTGGNAPAAAVLPLASRQFQGQTPLVVQRQPSGESSTAVSSGQSSSEASAPASIGPAVAHGQEEATQARAPEMDLEKITEHVSRAIFRQLAVERERRGF